MSSIAGVEPRPARTNPFEACTKTTVFLSLLLAMACQMYIAEKKSHWVFSVSVALFVTFFLLTYYVPRKSIGFIVGFGYLSRGVTLYFSHQTIFYDPITIALLALLLPTADFRMWRLPQNWKLPLVYWALIVAISWPIVFLRELDYTPFLTWKSPVFSNGLGLSAQDAVDWIANVAVVQLIGFLWIDFLFAQYGRQPIKRFLQEILVPFALAFVCNIFFAYYQAFVDLKFLNLPYWIHYRRVTGLMEDANSIGILAALWGPLFLFIASLQSRRYLRVVWGIAAAASLLCLFFSGCRSGLLIAVVSAIYLIWHQFRWTPLRRIRKALLIGPVLGFMILLLLFSFWPINVMSPVHRIISKIPATSHRTISSVVLFQAWDRLLLARTAIRAICDFPLTGTGVGSFNIIQGDYGMMYGLRYPSTDALNWYLHQLAELGFLGSLGWIFWFVLLFRMIVTPTPDSANRMRLAILKILLLSFGLASFFGVHTQQLEILLTSWCLVFLLWLLQHSHFQVATSHVGSSRGLKLWQFEIGVVLVYAALLTVFSLQMLRLPERALRFGWNYSNGFYSWEEEQSGETFHGEAFRWTHEEAVATVSVLGPKLKLTFWSVDPALSKRPVEVNVFVNGKFAQSVHLSNRQPITRFINMPPNEKRVILALHVHPTWYPSNYGMRDPRELGVAVESWSFVSP